MQRANIDEAVLAQIGRRDALLRDVIRSGGQDRWSHLFSHGHKFPTVRAAVRHGYLTEQHAYHYEITPDGRAVLQNSSIT